MRRYYLPKVTLLSLTLLFWSASSYSQTDHDEILALYQGWIEIGRAHV